MSIPPITASCRAKNVKSIAVLPASRDTRVAGRTFDEMNSIDESRGSAPAVHSRLPAGLRLRLRRWRCRILNRLRRLLPLIRRRPSGQLNERAPVALSTRGLVKNGFCLRGRFAFDRMLITPLSNCLLGISYCQGATASHQTALGIRRVCRPDPHVLPSTHFDVVFDASRRHCTFLPLPARLTY
jgi:hypothetical protein